jgi:hypothetical protein
LSATSSADFECFCSVVLLLFVMVLRLDSRVGVLTDAKNNGTCRIRGFRQVQSFLWIKPYIMCASMYSNFLGGDPLSLSFYSLRGYGLHGRSSWYDCTRLGLNLYLPYLQDLILFLSSKPPRFDASWPVSLGRVGRLMEGPQFLFTESRRHGTLGTRLRQWR